MYFVRDKENLHLITIHQTGYFKGQWQHITGAHEKTTISAVIIAQVLQRQDKFECRSYVKIRSVKP